MSEALSAEWQVWVAGNLIRGRDADEVVDVLIGKGIDPELARAQVAGIAQSPGVVAADQALRALKLAHRLRRAHLRLTDRSIPVRADLSAEDFRAQHLVPQSPVILPDLADDWPAKQWTWASLTERFGKIEVEVCERTDGGSLGRDRKNHNVKRTFAHVIQHSHAPTPGTEVYLTAPNQAVEGGPLKGLLEDVTPTRGYLAPARLHDSTSVWVGPATAFTPCHHDTADIQLTQLIGRKRIWLAPPEEVELADYGEGFWAGVDLTDDDALFEADLEQAAIFQCDVRPGDTLFIPCGWWHQVQSLEAGLTLTFAGLRHENHHEWYRPLPPEPKA